MRTRAEVVDELLRLKALYHEALMTGDVLTRYAVGGAVHGLLWAIEERNDTPTMEFRVWLSTWLMEELLRDVKGPTQ